MTLETKSRAEPLDQDTIFELLSNSRRRFVLHYLRHADGSVQLTTLADELAAWENGIEIDDLSSQQRKRVYVSLYQTHLEKLSDTGVIEYDSDEGVIELTDRAGGLFAYMDRGEDALYEEHLGVVDSHIDADESADPATSVSGLNPTMIWPAYYIGLAIVSAVIYLVVWVDLGPFALVSDATVGLTISAVLILSASVHFLAERGGRFPGGRHDRA